MDHSDHREFKDQIFDQFARIGAALSSPRRLELIDLLAQSERAVEELADLSGQSVANASRHLQVLRSARLVEVRREGSYAYYRLADAGVFRVWQALRELGEARLAELDRIVDSFVAERHDAEAVTAEELITRLREGDVVVVDVRPEAEYRAGHIRGAVSMPIAQLESVMSELPSDREVIAYCRGPYCVYADEAVAVLRARGIRARRLTTGLPDWVAAGYPVEPKDRRRHG